MADLIDLSERRKSAMLPPDAPSVQPVLDAVDLIRRYARDLFLWSQEQHGAGDIQCANLCCLADCIEREVMPAAKGAGE
jgi:hypothetical protein